MCCVVLYCVLLCYLFLLSRFFQQGDVRILSLCRHRYYISSYVLTYHIYHCYISVYIISHSPFAILHAIHLQARIISFVISPSFVLFSSYPSAIYKFENGFSMSKRPRCASTCEHCCIELLGWTFKAFISLQRAFKHTRHLRDTYCTSGPLNPILWLFLVVL